MLRRAETFNFGSGKPPAPRNIAAPFQRDEGHNIGILNSKEASHKDFVDFTNFNFVPLEDESSITFEKYCGPTPESNWVIPGVLLVGAYPASQDDGETFELITAILKLGVKKFVCLQQEYRTHGVTEDMWRNGHALRPYFEDVRLVVQLKHSIPELNEYNIVDEANLSFVHFPIKDCGITDDGRVLELAKSLVKAISEKEVIYLHCWGGHGRTGTVVCIMLHLMYGLTATEAMARCQLVHDLRQCPVQVGSPQTQPQRDQVVRIIRKLMSQTQLLRRTVSDNALSNNVVDASAEVTEHSPRSPAATVITHNLSLGHGHYPLGSVHLPPSNANISAEGIASRTVDPAAQATPSSAASNTPLLSGVGTCVSAQSADSDDPWGVDIVPGYDDVNIDSDDEGSNVKTEKKKRSFRFADSQQAAQLADLAGKDPVHEGEIITLDLEMDFPAADSMNRTSEVEEESAEISVRVASPVEPVPSANGSSNASPSPPVSLPPSSIAGGVRGFRNQRESR